MQEEQIRETIDALWRASAAGDADAERYLRGRRDLRLPQSGDASLDGTICRLCGVIIPANPQASKRGESSERTIFGLRNTRSTTVAERHTP